MKHHTEHTLSGKILGRVVPGFLLGLLMLGLGVYLMLPSGAQAIRGMPVPDITSDYWINSSPKSKTDLRDKVLLVEFWTFGCYNCRNVEPKVKEWHRRYSEKGLTIIGIHSPEFAYEKDVEAVKRYVKKNEIGYAVAIDNDFLNWRRFRNRYWPAMYLVDKRGVIRYVRIGEGRYDETEQMIRTLLAERS